MTATGHLAQTTNLDRPLRAAAVKRPDEIKSTHSAEVNEGSKNRKNTQTTDKDKATDTKKSKTVKGHDSSESGLKNGKNIAAKSAKEAGRETYKSLMKQGSRLLENGRIRQARSKFEAAARANPNRPSPFVQLGWCEINLQSYGRAVRQFKKALSVSPNHRDGTFGLGVAYEKMGRTKQAIKVYERYLARHPSDRHSRKIKFRLDRLRP